jgi:hypothetical protein
MCNTSQKKQFNGCDYKFENQYLFNKKIIKQFLLCRKIKPTKLLNLEKKGWYHSVVFESMLTKEHTNNLNHGKTIHNPLKILINCESNERH